MESRQRILEAARKVYEESGFRGATTRRIAAEAGVNEVTLFRIFGSKDALLSEAIRAGAGSGAPCGLPARPEHPEQEVAAWCEATMRHLRSNRALIRKTLSELEERPELTPCASMGPTCAARDLRAYIQHLCDAGLIDGDCPAEAASAMLLGAVFGDAMNRETMPEIFPYPVEDAPRLYAELFLRAIGLHSATKPERAVQSRSRRRAS
jgi:AcrR family transcriptional regulator